MKETAGTRRVKGGSAMRRRSPASFAGVRKPDMSPQSSLHRVARPALGKTLCQIFAEEQFP